MAITVNKSGVILHDSTVSRLGSNHRARRVADFHAPMYYNGTGLDGRAPSTETGAVYSPIGAAPDNVLAARGAFTNEVLNPVMGGTYTSGIAQSWQETSLVAFVAGVKSESTAAPGLHGNVGQRCVRALAAGEETAVGVEQVITSGWTASTSFYGRARFYVHSFTNDNTVTPVNRITFSVYTRTGASFVTQYTQSVTLTATGWHQLEISQTGITSFDGAYINVWADRGTVDYTIDTVDLFPGVSAFVTHFSGADNGASWDGTAYASSSTKPAIDLQYANTFLRNSYGHIGFHFYFASLPGSSVKMIDGPGPVDISINGANITATADGTNNLAAGNIAAGQWYHLALSWEFPVANGGIQYLHLDGVLDDFGTYGTATAPTFSGTIQVGAASGGGSIMGGYLKNLTFGKKLPTDEQVGALYSEADFYTPAADVYVTPTPINRERLELSGRANVVYTGGSVVNSATATVGKGFRERLGRYLDQIWPDWTLTHHNKSTGGTTSFWRLQMVDEIAALNPRIVVIDNVNDDDSHVAWEESGEAILRRLRLKCPKAYILGIWPYRPNDLIGDNAQYNQPVVDRWSAVCDELGIAYFDFAGYMEPLINAGTYTVGQILNDIVHPTDFGYELMYSKLAPFFKTYLSPRLIPGQWTGDLDDYNYIGTAANVQAMMRPASSLLGTDCAQITGSWSTKAGNFEAVAPTSSSANATIEFKLTGRYYGGLFTDVTDVYVSFDGGGETLCTGREVLIDAGSRASRTVRYRAASGTFTPDRVLAI